MNTPCCDKCLGIPPDIEAFPSPCINPNCPCHKETPPTTFISEKVLKEHLLANFCDGDSWKDADALSLTKHGALDVAEYFYELGHTTHGEDEYRRGYEAGKKDAML